MEEEINLREYLGTLARYWYWIVGLALVAAAIAFVVSSLLPPVYEARALVVVTRPRYQLQFDPRVQNLPFDPAQFSKGYSTIATSDDLLLAVLESTGVSPRHGNQSPQSLRQSLSAETAGDPNLIVLKARSQDPEEAATLANTWAGQFIVYLNGVYGIDGDLLLFEAQLAEAKGVLEEADGTLARFRSQYGLGFGEKGEAGEATYTLGMARRLQARTDLLIAYEARWDRIGQLLGEARAASAQVEDNTSPAIVAGLLADMLQLGLLEGGAAPLVQLNLGELDARASLSALTAALEAKQSSTDEAIARLTGEVEALQAELAGRQQELDQLLRDREVAQTTYLTLSNKLQEARIEADSESGDMVRLLSHAAAPREPVSPRRWVNTAVGVVLGLMIGVSAVFFLNYWREGATSKSTQSSELIPEQA